MFNKHLTCARTFLSSPFNERGWLAAPLGRGIAWSDGHFQQSQGAARPPLSPTTFNSWQGTGEPRVCGFQRPGFFSLPSLEFLVFQHLCLIGLGIFLAITLSVIIFPSFPPFLLELRLNVFRTSHPFLHFLDYIYSFLFPTYVFSLV